MTVERITTPAGDEVRRTEAVVVGASAGALDALTELLSALPGEFSLPILIVIHLAPDKKSAMAECLQAKCHINVREAEDKEPISSGTVYIAPPDYHLLVEADQRLSLSTEPPVLFSRPSIDVLFESAADVYAPVLIGIVLTGGNHDGSRGLRTIVNAGGVGLVQRPDLAFAPEMPRSALQACPSALAMSVPEIAAYLQEAAARK